MALPDAHRFTDPAFEHGMLVGTGRVTVGDATTAGSGELVCQLLGAGRLGLAASAEGNARVLLLGGEPLAERIVMW
ncbi:hypothetical protein OG946_01295 [Streptomyces sp. NBC_01808]|uniref:pirin-like C-terminal cupin domain-containing protein n=1 Tax=Streptomyces sp. NBC_01808 TaxID=2975947 RepID=UPI002DD9653B|nr:pirin-like C-terminal cupin domain-containing protein [Streptomyces sp. NBC_01808]WSA36122.1 hypothetical protein OG946_01295 [Streptomyces sp. NBC_01808]